MLTLRQAPFASGLTERTYSEIEAACAAGRRVYLLVPEQQTLIAEKEAALRLPASAPLTFEVTNFSRLANTVFRTVGGISGTYSDKTIKALVMWRALTEAAPLLSTGNKTSVTEGSVRASLAALGEMQALGIDADALRGASLSESLVSEGRLRNKLADLSVILATYRKLHDARFADAAEDVPAMTKKLDERPELLRDALIFLDGFTSFTEPQLSALRRLISRADVRVNLVLPRADAASFLYTETRTTAAALSRLCDLAGADKKLERIEESATVHSPLLLDAARGLWHTNYKFDKDSLQFKDDLRIFKAKGPKEEAEFVAADIAKRVQSGASYSDFAVVVRNNASYAGILDRALLEAGVPHFFSREESIAAFEAIKLIGLAYRTVIFAFRRRDVIAYAKCGLSGLTPDEVDRLELYAERWQITGGRFTDGELWNMNPAGMTDRRPKDADAVLQGLNLTKATLIPPLVGLRDAARSAMTVRDHSAVLVSFLHELNLEEKLAARAKLLESLRYPGAEENARLYSVICDTLDRLVDAIGDFVIDTRGYASLLSIAFSAVSIARLPAHLDEVTVGAADMLRLSGKAHVYLVGVNEGEFPASSSDSSYFTERERAALLALGFPTQPDEDLRCARELFCFSRAFTSASKSVTLLYTEHDAAFKLTSPASVISDLSLASDGVLRPVPIESLPIVDRVYSPVGALAALPDATSREQAALRSALNQTIFRKQLTVADGDLYNATLRLTREATRILYPGEIGLTQSRIDQYVRCPLSYFCVYQLKLDDGRRATFDAMNIGTLIHSVLENLLSGMKEKGELVLSEEERQKRVRALAEEYVARVSVGDAPSVRRDHLIRILTASADVVAAGLLDELRDSRFRPAYFELNIEKADGGKHHRETEKSDGAASPEPIRIPLADGTNAYVYGQIDRVDTYRHGEDLYVRVIDYKTGSKNFSPSDMEKKQNLQMFLYLRSVVESERFRTSEGAARLIPAGVIYVSTVLDADKISTPSDDGVESLKAKQKRQGMILNDEIALAAMNPRYSPVAFTVSGEPDRRSANRLYTEEGWHDLSATVEESVRGVAEGMKTGMIPASPLRDKKHKDVCDHCAFKAVCRNVGGADSSSETEN